MLAAVLESESLHKEELWKDKTLDEFDKRCCRTHVVAKVVPGFCPPTVLHKDWWCMTCKGSASSNVCGHELRVLHREKKINLEWLTDQLKDCRRRGKAADRLKASQKEVSQRIVLPVWPVWRVVTGRVGLCRKAGRHVRGHKRTVRSPRRSWCW